MQTTTLNIAILPSNEVTAQAIEMSKKIASEIWAILVDMEQ